MNKWTDNAISRVAFATEKVKTENCLSLGPSILFNEQSLLLDIGDVQVGIQKWRKTLVICKNVMSNSEGTQKAWL